MTVFELHLQVNQRLQEVASYKRDKFKPEEIDMALNKAMFRLLEKGVDSNFTDNEINLTKVSALIQKNKVQEVIIPSNTDVLYEDSILNCYTVMPPDFYWLVNNRLEVITDPVNCETAPTIPTATITEYTAIVPFPALGSAPYFANTSVNSSTLGLLYTSPTEIAAGFNSSQSKYVVVNNIVEYFYRKQTNFKAYWERYRDIYSKNSFIFVATVSIGTVTLSSNSQTSSTPETTTNYSGYNRGGIPVTAEATVTSTKVATANELYDVLRNNSFYQTRSIQPVIDQTEDYLIFYRDESFLITRSYSDYIRKPRTISLALNQSCELASATHPKIVDLTVEILRLDTKDQAYPQTVQDTQLRTN